MERQGPLEHPAHVAPAPRRVRAAARSIVVQPSLEVGRVDDPFEREAEAVADLVVAELPRWPESSAESAAGALDDGGGIVGSRMQRRAGIGSVAGVDVADPAAGALDADTDRRIQARRGGGAPLPGATRTRMEQAFAADFGSVRVHEGPAVSELNTRVQAKAFTVGNDIFFRDGVPDASSGEGRRLLAHELTHTIQQNGRVGRVVKPDPDPGAVAIRHSARNDAPGERVRRSPVAVSGRTSGAVVQRDGETRAAWEALAALITRAETLKVEALAEGVDSDRLAELTTKIDALWEEAEGHVKKATSATKDSTADGYKKQMNTRLLQVKAKWSSVHGKEVAANSAATSITSRLAQFRLDATTAITNARRDASDALVQLRTVATMQPNTMAPDVAAATRASCATGARQDHATLTTACTEFATASTTTLQDAADWVEVAKGDNRKQAVAENAARQLATCSKLTAAAMARLRDDADHAATLVEAIISAGRGYAQAQKTEKQLKIASEARNADATRAEQLYAKAEVDDRTAAEAVERAKDLLDEAIGKARQAERTAAATKASADAAAQTGELKAGALPFFEQQLRAWPSADASAMVDQRRSEAGAAQAEAVELKDTSEQQAHEAATLRADAKPFEDEHRTAREAAGRAADEKAAMAGNRDSTKQLADEAGTQHSDATGRTGTRLQEGRDAKTALHAHLVSVDALATDIPDEDVRTRLRVSFGDAGLRALRAIGLRVDVLEACEQPLVVAIATWGLAGAADVAVRLQGLAAGAPVALAEFWRAADGEAITSARALQILDCVGGGFTWWIVQCVPSCARLLELDWPTADVGALMGVAKADAELGGKYLSDFVGLVERVGLTLVQAELLLRAPITRYYVVGEALTGIEVLLLVEHWHLDKVLELVTAADAGPKPYRHQFDTFCQLVHASAVSDLNAIKIMRAAAGCTAAYLVEKAFAVVRDAVLVPWAVSDIKDLVAAAATDASLDRVQLERFWALVHANNFTAANAVKCLKSASIASWDALMDRVDDFIADGNTRIHAPVRGVARAQLDVPDPDDPTLPNLRFVVEVKGIRHFCRGHTYAHYEFTDSNIRRGDRNQPSTMWPVGTTPANIRASAVTAIGAAGVQTGGRLARDGNGTKGTFDQSDHGAYSAGVEWKPVPQEVRLTQFYALPGTSVAPDVLEAIGRLFGRIT